MKPLAATTVIAIALVAGCAGSREPTNKEDLAKQFHTFFGFDPPPSVTDLRAKSVWVGDGMADWLSFKCGSDVFDRVVASDDYKMALPGDITRSWQSQVPEVDSSNPNAPRWWPKAPASAISRLYHLSRPYIAGKTPTQSSVTYFWRDEPTGVVFAYYSAWR